MDIERIRTLRGPNVWSRNLSLEALVHCEPPETGLGRNAELESRIRSMIPGIGAVRATGLEYSNLTLAHFLGKVALRMQIEAGSQVTFLHVAGTSQPGTFRVVVQYEEESVGHMAIEEAEKLIRAAIANQPFNAKASISQIHEEYENVKLGPSTGSIVHAALRRNIPIRRLTTGSLVQLGWGSKQRRIQAAETDTTSAISETIAQDKDLTKTLLRAAGIPSPLGRLCPTFDDALAAFHELIKGVFNKGVVVKPSDGNQGKGVTVNILDTDHLRIAYDAAKPYGSGVPMVEEFIPGHDYRFLVVGNTLVAAARREPPHVVADGKHTIEELIQIENQNPLRGEGHGSALTKLRLDEIAKARIAKQGYQPSSIPEAGIRVVLRNNANLSTGGTATDVTDTVHPQLAQTVIEAAQLIGIDICGVDVVCQKVDEPLETQGGGIVELNAAPGLRMHLEPSIGRGRDVGQAIIDWMFAPQDNARIPIVAVTGTNGKTTTVRLIEHILRFNNDRVGFTGTEGVWVNGHQVDTGDCSGPKSATKVLMHPETDAAVLECARGGILREGLGFDLCDVGIVTNIGEGDHLGIHFVDTVEDLALLKSVLVQNIQPKGLAVLNADDKHTLAMMRLATARVLLFSSKPGNTAIEAHQAQGHPTLLHQDRLIHIRFDDVVHTIDLAKVPLTHDGQFVFQVQNVMCALAAGLALKVPMATIEAALANFESTPDTVPGRFNTFKHRGSTVIADYGHNPDALSALVKTLNTLPAKTRRIVLSAAGDRRDEDIIAQGKIAGGFFDHIVLYEDACLRGRPENSTFQLLLQGIEQAQQESSTQLAATPAKQQTVETIRGEFKATQYALDSCEPGDVTLVLIDQVDAALAYLQNACKKN